MAESLEKKDKVTKAIYRKRNKRLVAKNASSSSIMQFYRVQDDKDQKNTDEVAH